MILLLLSVKRLFNIKAVKPQTDSNLKRYPVALVDPDTARGSLPICQFLFKYNQPKAHTIILNNLCFWNRETQACEKNYPP